MVPDAPEPELDVTNVRKGAAADSSDDSDEEDETVREVHIDTIRAVCLCWRNCHQLAELTKPVHARNGALIAGDEGRPRFSEMVCPVLLHRHLAGKIKIIGL